MTSKCIFIVMSLVVLNSGRVYWSQIDNGDCIVDNLLQHSYLDINWVGASMRSGWYIPLSSRTYIHSYCHFLKDKSCESLIEMSQMCLRLRSDFTEIPFLLEHTGFDHKMILNCTLDGKIHECHGEKVNKYGHNLKHSVKVYITYTDNKEIAIAIKCQQRYGKRGRRAWSLMSTNPRLSNETREMVLNHVARLGFDIDKTVTMDYSNCKLNQ